MSSAISTIRVPRRQSLAACVSAVFALSASSAVYAATFPVTNCLDDGSVGSLRWAAGQAVNGGDVIDMTNVATPDACIKNKDGFGNTILLASTVTIADGVTISGPPVPALAVSTNNNGLIFTSPGYLTIINLGITYGRNTKLSGNTVYGGCVYARDYLAISGGKVDHCAAYTSVTGANAKGGAIAVSYSAIKLTNTSISHSDAISKTSGDVRGGSVYAYNEVTLTGSTVSYSNADAYLGNSAGGAISSKVSTVTLSGSYVGRSRAVASGGHAYGGAVYSGGAVALDSLSNVAHSYVTAYGNNGDSGKGGGIFSKGSMTIAQSTVDINSAITYSNITSKNARGGNLYAGGLITLSNAFISDGTTYTYASAPSAGGGVYSNGGLAATYSSIERNRSKSTSGQLGRGGGIAIKNGDAYIRGTTISGNYASLAGSALNFVAGGASTVNIINSTISGNSTSSDGVYAVYVEADSTKIFNSTIAYNTVGTGPGVYITGSQLGSTVGLYATLMSSNSYGSGTQNDFAKEASVAFTASSSKNLIRNPGSLVPADTVTGKCPLLHRLASNGGPTQTHRLGGGSGSKNPAIDAGSNFLSLGSDQRGGNTTATTPLRVSGSAADIGAYEVQQADIIFDSEFDTCPN